MQTENKTRARDAAERIQELLSGVEREQGIDILEKIILAAWNAAYDMGYQDALDKKAIINREKLSKIVKTELSNLRTGK